MKLKVQNYTGPFRVFSLALDEKTKADLTAEDVDFLYISPNAAEVFPDNMVLSRDPSLLNQFRSCNNYDVFGISEDGTVFRYYDDSSVENAFFITEKCNSNCVMCPSPDFSRKRGNSMEIEDLITIASHIPSDTAHITVTGGEPFMIGKSIFRLFDYCKEKFINTEFLILTNARIFAVNEYCELLKHSIPLHSMVGVPIHGSCAEIHDSLTRVDGSFKQTMIGLQRLHSLGIPIEIRVVVCKANLKDLETIARLISSQFNKVDHVSIMAMEMTGNAFLNADMLWVPYRESFKYIRPAINLLINAGIDVRLYNYPLCTVEPENRLICAKSISSWKIRYTPKCEVCSIKESCGGIFAGSYRLECDEIEAVL